MFSRVFQGTFHFLRISRDSMRDWELKWAISRPKSQAKGMTLDAVKALVRPWFKAMTRLELQSYDAYMHSGLTTLHAVQVNQNVEAGQGQRSPSTTTLHTIIKNCGITMCREEAFTCEELLLSQCFATRLDLSAPRSGKLYRTCSFAPAGDGSDENMMEEWAERGRASVSGQAGNSMNLSVCAVIWPGSQSHSDYRVCVRSCWACLRL
jgi:hypothetical protein